MDFLDFEVKFVNNKISSFYSCINNLKNLSFKIFLRVFIKYLLKGIIEKL